MAKRWGRGATAGPCLDRNVCVPDRKVPVHAPTPAAQHVLVVTRQFESQADALNARDLGATMQVLRAMPQGGVAFYNCGEHSGRSQPHKHLQVVPLPFDVAQPPRPPIADVVEAACRDAPVLEPVELRALPFRAYAARLDTRCVAGARRICLCARCAPRA